MAKSEFSETQFVFGYLCEMYLRHTRTHPGINFSEFFLFPSTVVERDLPVDFLLDKYSYSEYYQFKRSDCIGVGRGRKPIVPSIVESYLPAYRFEIYNNINRGLGQFEKLKLMASKLPGDQICYCAPCFHTDFEFKDKFDGGSIIRDSVLIDCHQFNDPYFSSFDIRDGIDHYFYYKSGVPTGYLCSDHFEIRLSKYDDIHHKESKTSNFTDYVKYLYQEIYMADFTDKNNVANFQVKFTGEVKEQMTIVMMHLFERYNIFWIPFFEKT